MEVYKGTDRIAYVGRNYTVKIARSNLKQFIKYARHVKERTGLKGVLAVWNAHSVDAHQSLKNFLLHGVVANRREQNLAKRDKSIVFPTVSILNGLVNVQPTAKPTGLEDRVIHSAFVNTLGPRVTMLGHMIEDTNNIGTIDGQVRFVDGGDRGLEKLAQFDLASLQQALGSLAAQIQI